MVNQAHSHRTDTGVIIGCQCNAPAAPLPVYATVCEPHTHVAPDGTLVKCYHACKNVLTSPAFWIGSTLSFPIEHAIWTKLPVLSAIAKWAGL